MGKQIVKKEDTSLTAPAPSYLDKSNAGMEDARPQDLVLPRLILMQAMSPKVRDGLFREGDLVNSLTGEKMLSYGDVTTLCPILHYLEWIEWGSRDAGEGIIARSRDAQSDLAMRAARGELKPTPAGGRGRMAVTEYHNFIVALDGDFQHCVVLSCNRSSHKKGKQLLSMARYRGNYPLFAGQYTLQVIEDKNPAGQKYRNYSLTNAGWVSEEHYALAKGCYEMLKGVSVVADMKGQEHEEPGSEI